MADTSRRQLIMAGLAGASVLTAAQPAHAQTPGPPAHGERIPVAFLMGEAATMIDFAGPWEALQDAAIARVPGFELYTVAQSRDPLRVTGGMEIIPKYTFDDAPAPKAVIIPAQAGSVRADASTPAKIEWLRRVDTQAEIMMSICTGAFLLARTGLIDGREATTHHFFYDIFEREFPGVRMLRGRRFVDNGKYISGGGLTSGIDATLHIVARFYGQDVAQTTAEWMEHSSEGWRSGMVEG